MLCIITSAWSSKRTLEYQEYQDLEKEENKKSKIISSEPIVSSNSSEKKEQPDVFREGQFMSQPNRSNLITRKIEFNTFQGFDFYLSITPEDTKRYVLQTIIFSSMYNESIKSNIKKIMEMINKDTEILEFRSCDIDHQGVKDICKGLHRLPIFTLSLYGNKLGHIKVINLLQRLKGIRVQNLYLGDNDLYLNTCLWLRDSRKEKSSWY